MPLHYIPETTPSDEYAMTTKPYVTSNVIPNYHKKTKEKPILKHNKTNSNNNNNRMYRNDDDNDDDDDEALEKFHERIKRGRCDSPPVLQKRSRSAYWSSSEEDDNNNNNKNKHNHNDNDEYEHNKNKSLYKDSTSHHLGSPERRKRGRPRKEDLDKPSNRRRSSTIGSTNEISTKHNNSNNNSHKINKKKKLENSNDVATTTATTKNNSTIQTDDKDDKIKNDENYHKRNHHKHTNNNSKNDDDKESINDDSDDSDNEKNEKSKSKSRPSSYTDPNRIDKAGRTKLFVYTSSGNLEKVKELVSLGAEVNFKDHAGWVPLHEAALKGQYEIAKFLIEKGANVNARGFDDDTPLHDACSGGFTDLVQLLVDSGADVFALNSDKQRPLDVCDDETCSNILEIKMKQLDRLVAQDENGRTILHKACCNGDYDEVSSLLTQGANTNSEDKKLWTPIHEAAKYGHLPVVKLLVEHGADINHIGYQGNSVLHHACKHSHGAIVHFLLDKGADIHASNHSRKTPYDVTTDPAIRRELAAKLDEEKKQRATSDAIDEITFTTLKQRKPTTKSIQQSRPLSREERKIQAIMKSFEVLEQQQQPKQSQPTRSSSRRYTSSNRSSSVTDDNMDEDTITDKDNNNNTNNNKNDDDNVTTISEPPRKKRTRNHKRQSSVLTAESNQSSRECSVDLPENNNNNTTNKSSSTKESTKKVDATKLDPHKKDTSGRTHLHRYAIRGDVEVCKILLKAGANPNVPDNAGYTPLHESSLRGRVNVAKLLLEHGADANAKGLDLDTALHDAIDNKHPEVVDVLLQFGADPQIKNGKGMSAMEIAKELELVDVQRLLKQAISNRKNNSNKNNEASFNQQKNIQIKNEHSSQKNVTLKKNDKAPKQSRKRRLVLAADLEQSSSTSSHKRHFSDGFNDIKSEPQDAKPFHHFDSSMDMDVDKKPAFRSSTSPTMIKSNILEQTMMTLTSEDGPNTPIPTPVMDKWQSRKIKEEIISPSVSQFDHDKYPSSTKGNDNISTPLSPRSPTLSEAMRFLPLYIVQLIENDGVKSSLYVLDLQVGLLLNLSTEKLWKKYPDLPRRKVTLKEKERLWVPLASMICTQASPHVDLYACDKKRTASLMARHKNQEKQRFLDMPLFFVQLDPIITLIKHDYSYLSKNIITITLDMGYKQDQHKPFILPASSSSPLSSPSESSIITSTTPSSISSSEKTASSLSTITTTSTILNTTINNSNTNTNNNNTTTLNTSSSTPSSPQTNITPNVPLNPILLSKTPLKKRPNFGLPPKFAMKMQKHLMYNNNNDNNNNNGQ
ncbi:unnamed protein product [Cunninghamella blakesleeana]